GEGLGEDDYWFAHGEYLSDPLVHVPLLLRVPGRVPSTRDDVTSLVDVLPTLARLLGMESPAGLRGRDLYAPGVADAPGFAYLASLRESTVPRFGFVSGDAVYLVSMEAGGPVDTVASIPGRAPTTTARTALAGELERFRQGLGIRPAVRQALSPADRERLRALGYLADHD